MILEEKRGKLDAKGIKCVFLEYCEGMKTCRLICVVTKRIIQNRDVVFVEDSENIRNDLGMLPGGEMKALQWWS